MSYTVGLDFGTHQTKVCIENATNPAQKLYEFLEFNTMDKTTVLFPSIVQINNDDTISYGFVDINKCKILIRKNTPSPELVLPIQPTMELPKEPQKLNYPSKPQQENTRNLTWKEQLLRLKNKKDSKAKFSISKWKEECNEIDRSYIETYQNWENTCRDLKNGNNIEVKLWESKIKKLKNDYKFDLLELEKKRYEKLQFRYFKLATFSKSIQWKHNIEPEIISVWYIAYNLFLLQEKLGNEFYVQLGVPSGTSAHILRAQKKKAFAILIAAYKLVELYKTKDTFLKEKYTDLLEFTEISYDFSDEVINFYGIDIIPEAFAGLFAITQQKRLETGMNLLIDIGGGTTDIAFFTITENHLPNIHSVISFPKGLNFVFEKYILQNKELSISDVQDLFFAEKGEESFFSINIKEYQNHLKREVAKMVESIESSFTLRRNFHGIDIYRLRDALKKRPVIFCGGGSLYKTMRTSVLNFTDKKLINKNLLNIPTIVNQNIEEKLFTILATSYGLSIPMENEIHLTPIEKVFNHLEAPEIKQKDYGYEHGLSDF